MVVPRCRISGFRVSLKSMEVHLTPEEQSQLAQIASKAETAPQRLVDQEARFVADVEKGIASASRGEVIEEEEMDARLGAMFKA